jgi:hypothetical protein
MHRLSRRTTALLLLAVTAAPACGRPPGAAGGERREQAGWSLSYRLEGGLGGFDVTFVVGADGRAEYRRRRPTPAAHEAVLEPARVEALARLVRESGFLDLAGGFPVQQPVADGFTYRLRWHGPDGVKEVVGQDGAVLPPAFVAVREAVAALEREVIARSGGGEEDGK